MNEKSYAISKTSFLKFEQCQKAFFLYKKHPYLKDKLSIDKQLTFKRGHDVGYYAQKLFPGGIDVSLQTKNFSEALELTEKLVAEKQPVIYEATFLHNNVLVMADILCFDDSRYTAYEVKSSLKVSETYLKDGYLQYYVIKNVLPELDDLFLVTLNPDYRLEGEADPRKLFRRRSLKLKAVENFSYFEHRVNEALLVLEKNAIPNIPIGKHCFRPYQCDFFGSCWKDVITEKSIFNLPLIDRNSQFEWYEKGLRNMDELTGELNEKLNIGKIKDALLSGKSIINSEWIRRYLSDIKQPAAAMDMEIWNPAIPQLPGTGPFEQIPFLVCFYNGESYSSFFADHSSDETEAFARQLITLSQDYATLLVYDKTMEVAVIDALIRKYPALAAELQSLKNKLKDLFDVFVNIHYYHPAFKSNFSLKGVSGVLLKDASYNGINSGLEAMNVYSRYRLCDDLLEKERLKQELVTYCDTDCFATYKLAEFLQQEVEKTESGTSLS